MFGYRTFSLAAIAIMAMTGPAFAIPIGAMAHDELSSPLTSTVANAPPLEGRAFEVYMSNMLYARINTYSRVNTLSVMLNTAGAHKGAAGFWANRNHPEAVSKEAEHTQKAQDWFDNHAKAYVGNFEIT